MVSRYLGAAWGAYKKNAGTIIGANLLLLVIAFIILFATAAPFVSTLFELGFFSGQAAPLTDEQNALLANAIISNIGTFFIGMLALSVVGIALRTGLVGIYAAYLNKKKAGISEMFSIAKEKFWASLGSALIMMVIAVALIFLLTIPTSIAFVGNLNALRIAIAVELFALLLFMLLFSLRVQTIVVSGSSAWDSIKASASIVKANYAAVLWLTITLVILSLIMGKIPFIGFLISTLVVQPVLDLAYTALYMEKAGKKTR